MWQSRLKWLYHSCCFEWPERLLYIRAILVVLGGFIVNVTLNAMWTFGNMEPYIVSYIRNRSHPTDLQENIGPWVFTALVVGQGTTILLGGFLYSKVGPRVTTLLGAWIYSSGILLSYFTIQSSFWLFVLTYGLIPGFGLGIAAVSPLSAAMKWLPDWKGVANGIVLAGYGIGILSFDFVQTIFTNPSNIPVGTSSSDENYFSDPEVLNRIPYTFLVLGGSYAVLQLLGSVLLTDPPEDYLLKENEEESSATNIDVNSDDRRNVSCCSSKRAEEYFALTTSSSIRQCSPSEVDEDDNFNQTHEEREELLQDKTQLPSEEKTGLSTGSSTHSDTAVSLTPLQMLKRWNFYLLWFIVFFSCIAIYFIATYYKVFGFTFIADDHFLAVVGSVGAICDTTGCVVSGLLADKLTYKVVLTILTAAFTVFLLTFYASSMAGKPMFIIWVGVLWFVFAGIITMYPTAIAQSFGLRYYSTNYALLFTSQVSASIFASLIDTFLSDYVANYGILLLISGISFISFVLALFYQP